MELETNPLQGQTLIVNLADPAQREQALRAFKALASEPRLEIMRLLSGGAYNVKEIAEALHMPLSTATLHVRALEEGGVIATELSAATRGLQKMCSRRFESLLLRLPPANAGGHQMQTSIPVGAYTGVEASSPCGLAGPTGMIGLLDDPASFFEPGRLEAQLLWFSRGWVEYRFPHRLPAGACPHSLSVAVELGSEAPLHAAEWPSDITFWLNEVEVATWTAPGDFGGRRGLLTPEWWPADQSQYGLLKQLTVSTAGSFVDGLRLSPVTIADLGLQHDPLVRLRLGVKPGAANPRGLNLFGRAFGNYPQDIVVQLRYAPGG